MKIKIINTYKHDLLRYEIKRSADTELKAKLKEDVILKTLKRALITTGLLIELPAGYESQIRPRSGLAVKKGINDLNNPVTIDSD